ATLHARATTTANASAQLEQPTAPKLPALNAQACDDAARKTAAATDDKPARSWAKHTTRRTYTSYRLTLELSGARLFARPLGRVVRCGRHAATFRDLIVPADGTAVMRKEGRWHQCGYPGTRSLTPPSAKGATHQQE